MVVATRPPAKPAAGIIAPAIQPATDPPNIIAQATPNDAPLETPISPGSARGFRKIPCNAAPLTPRVAPTSAPKITRGARIEPTTARCIGSEVVLPKTSVTSADHTSAGAI